jgi:hypothetical protein
MAKDLEELDEIWQKMKHFGLLKELLISLKEKAEEILKGRDKDVK